MILYLHNSLTRRKEAFEPIDANNVRMYVCGPTVYDYAHIGNGRPPVVFDILYRLLRHRYGVDHVTYARNFTDIDDKIMKRAVEEGTSIEDVSERFTKIYQDDMKSLGVLPPNIEPKATQHLPEMIAMMETLIAKGNAYEADGHVLFHTPSMDDYGRLSGHGQDELIAGSRVEVAPYKKDATDFVMWKPSSDDQPGWDSPWGRGRPGWHLECSCMIAKHLGETIDIHGGGQDLIFPHHENEIAQSQCTHGKKFVNYWLHNGYLTMTGEKMSKSLGNVRKINDLAKEFPGEALRLTLLSAHYRQPLDFNGDVIKEQIRRLDKWYRVAGDVEAASEAPQDFLEALYDDLNTPKALAILQSYLNSDPAAFKAGAQFIGLMQQTADLWFKGDVSAEGSDDAAHIDALVAERDQAKKDKNWGRADEIRDQLKEQGIVLEDSPDGTIWRRG